MKNIKNIIFDLDGTLLNTLEDLMISNNYALEQYHYPTHNIDEQRTFVGNGVTLQIKRSMPEKNNNDLDQVIKTYKEHYAIHALDHTAPYKGINEMLAELKRRNIKIAVVTNKMDDTAHDVVEHYFPGMFDIVVGQIDGIKTKPSPDMVIKAMNYLNADISNTIFIGDTDVDYQTAVNSNLVCISCSWGFKTKEFIKEHCSEYIIDEPMELINYL